MFRTAVGIGQEVRVAPAQVAGEDEPARPAVLAVIELDDRRAQDVPGVEVGQGHARHDLHRLAVRARAGAARPATRRRSGRRAARAPRCADT